MLDTPAILGLVETEGKSSPRRRQVYREIANLSAALNAVSIGQTLFVDRATTGMRCFQEPQMSLLLLYPVGLMLVLVMVFAASRTTSEVDLNRLREIAYICAVFMRPKTALHLRAQEAATEPIVAPTRLIVHGRNRAGGVDRGGL